METLDPCTEINPKTMTLDEELVDSFFGAVNVSTDPNRTEAPHPKFALLHKDAWRHKVSAPGDQEKRRREFLEAQKKKRQDLINARRRLDLDEESSVQNGSNSSNWRGDANRSNQQQASRILTHERLKNQLMQSEWMVEVPERLAEDWLLVLCPVGKRCLVIARDGQTRAYGRAGNLFKTFPSLLPGGNHDSFSWRQSRRQSCILDCIYSDRSKTFNVLDMIAYNGMYLYDSDTECRFHFVRCKFSEESYEATVGSVRNPYRFVPLKPIPCDKDSLETMLHPPWPFPGKLDGLLFFHKQLNYIPGRTPLGAWLKLYMVPEILGLQIDIQEDDMMDHSERGKGKKEKTKAKSTDYRNNDERDKMSQGEHVINVDSDGDVVMGLDSQQTQNSGKNYDKKVPRKPRRKDKRMDTDEIDVDEEYSIHVDRQNPAGDVKVDVLGINNCVTEKDNDLEIGIESGIEAVMHEKNEHEG